MPTQKSAIGNRQSAIPEPLIHTVKEMASALGRNEKYVIDMKHGGFKLPATLSQAAEFIREKGPPTRFRLYSHRPS